LARRAVPDRREATATPLPTGGRDRLATRGDQGYLHRHALADLYALGVMLPTAEIVLDRQIACPDH
jgi:hypothetical protein